MDLISTINSALGGLGNVVQGIQNAVKAGIETADLMSDRLTKSRLKKIANALALFYFSPVGIRMDIRNFILDPCPEYETALMAHLNANQQIKADFETIVFADIDSDLFQLPLQELEQVLGGKGRINEFIADLPSFMATERSEDERNAVLKQLDEMFDGFNHKVNEAVQNINELAASH